MIHPDLERLTAESEAICAAADAAHRDLTDEELAHVRRNYAEFNRIRAMQRPTGGFRSRAEMREFLRGGGLSKSRAERAASAAWAVLDPETAAADAVDRISAATDKLRST